MKTLLRVSRRPDAGRSALKRRGSVLLVVIGLLGLLLLLGFMFFSFATYESNSAQSFSEAAKVHNVDDSTDALWRWALQQLIIGPDDNLEQSALWGGKGQNARGSDFGKHSLLGTMYDSGYAPYNGEGVNVIWDPTELSAMPVKYVPAVDQDFNGTPDADQTALLFNYSPAATGNRNTSDTQIGGSPSSAVDYTYPDINNLFLAHIADVPIPGNTSGATQKLLIPSFHRPQLLYDPTTGQYDANWPTNTAANMPRKVMRAHPGHKIAGTNEPRFLGTFPFTPTTTGEYDLDLDGDGFKEAVLLDLDYPVQQLPNGKYYVPLFAFTVIDLDGLINLNAHGNLAGYRNNLDNTTNGFGHDAAANRILPISRSNQALTPSEVNPWWALRDPLHPTRTFVGGTDPAFDQYEPIFGNGPGSWAEAANMDMLFLNWGRPQWDLVSGNAVDLHTGRWGDRDRLDIGVDNLANNNQYNLAVFHPEPGSPQVDDDSDQFTGETLPAHAINARAYRHPIDFRGGGLMYNQSITNRAGSPKLTNVFGNRLVQYQDFNSSQNLVQWGQTAYGLMQYSPGVNQSQLVDHPAETILARQFLSPADGVFSAQENEALHKSPTDPDANLVNDAIGQLLSFSLKDEVEAQNRRKQFTFNSADRKQFGLPLAVTGANARTSEWSSVTFKGNTYQVFPPRFLPGSLTSSVEIGDTLDPTTPEPIRPELRKVLEVVFQTKKTPYQLRWDINKVWSSWYRENNQAAQLVTQYRNLTVTEDPYVTQDTNGIYQRPLTPHPIGLGAGRVTGPYPYPQKNQNFASLEAQEYWARKDRQDMARDIYVLVYLLCGGYSTDSVVNGGSYTDRQKRDMAQFAVNVVDALDTDEVITRFIYDKNPTDGWGATDDYFGFTEDATAGSVDGVEAQLLSFSEALVFKHRTVLDEATMMPEDHEATLLDDSQVPMDGLNTRYRFFGYWELQNTNVASVSLNGGFQLVHRDGPNERRVTIKVPDTLPMGESLVVGCRSHVGADVDASGNRYTSAFKMDVDWQTGEVPTEGDMQIIAPNFAVPGRNQPTSNYFLDLVHTADESQYTLIDGQYDIPSQASIEPGTVESHSSDPDGFFNYFSYVTDGDTDQATFILRRRLNTSRTAPTNDTDTTQQQDNPWVEIDRITVEIPILSSDPTSQQALMDPDHAFGMGVTPYDGDFQAALNNIRSFERSHPLDGTAASFAGNWVGSSMLASPRTNTLGAGNTQSANGGSIWQPHFDRDFTSTAELLSLPTYGPHLLTRKLSRGGRNVAMDQTDATGTGNGYPLRTIGARVFNPFADSDDDGTSEASRWYRLFEYISVTDRLHRHPDGNGKTMAGSYFNAPVTVGKINLNGIRHRGVLFGMLDDPTYFEIANDNSFTNDLWETSNTRNWFNQFLYARDGYDPTFANYVPGAVGSRPFRSLNFVGAGLGTATANRVSLPLEWTVFRGLMSDMFGDVNGNNQRDMGEVGEDANGNLILDPGEDTNMDGVLGRKLFEVGRREDFANLDPAIRNRLLQKVMNNSTTRSHCFATWIGVEFFEATNLEDTNNNGRLDGGEDQNGNGVFDYQIGAKLPPADARGHRMFGIIDRSVAEDAYNRATGKFDFEPLVIYRRTIE